MRSASGRQLIASQVSPYDFDGVSGGTHQVERTGAGRAFPSPASVPRPASITIVEKGLLPVQDLNARENTVASAYPSAEDMSSVVMLPFVLGGDFNVSRYDSLVQDFAAADCQTVQFAKATWRRRPYVLDHIFYNRHLRCLRHEVKPTMASDHHVLVAEFEYVF